MSKQSALSMMTALIMVIALFAAGMGLFWPHRGEPYTRETLRGEVVTIAGQGLYRYDSLSLATQAQAQDVVTLVIGLPLLLVSSWMARRGSRRGSLRGKLLLTGTLGYFLYAYMSMTFLSAYNELFLAYVALFSLSFFAFILSMMSFDLATLPQHFSTHLPRRTIAGVLFASAAFLLLAWLGRIIPPLLQGQTPALENATTLVIQGMDLALIVPSLILAGILLLRRSAWGFLLTSVMVLKMVTLGAAVSAMGVTMWLTGVAISPVELVVFLTITLINTGLAFLLLKHVVAQVETPRAFKRPNSPTTLPKGAR